MVCCARVMVLVVSRWRRCDGRGLLRVNQLDDWRPALFRECDRGPGWERLRRTGYEALFDGGMLMWRF
jgi:hypothetical protein